MPQPQLNFEDTKLREALAELADLEQAKRQGKKPSAPNDEPEQAEIQRAASAPILLEPLPQAQPIALEPAAHASRPMGLAHHDQQEPDAPPGVLAGQHSGGGEAHSAIGRLEGREQVIADADEADELVAVVIEEPESPHRSKAKRKKAGSSRHRPSQPPLPIEESEGDALDAFISIDNAPVEVRDPSQRLRSVPTIPMGRPKLLFGVLVAGIVCGWLLSGLFGWIARSSVSGETTTSATGSSESAVETAGNGQAAVFGRVTYRTVDGQSLPDDGARVIALPRDRSDGRKLSVEGFRPADDAASLTSTREAIRSIGGDVATADANGQFEVSLPKSGEYYLLFLSHYQSRPPETSVSADVTAALSAYFDQPLQLLGRVQSDLQTVRYNGAIAQPWDHSFPPR